MQSDQHFHPKRIMRPLLSQVGGDYVHIPVASPFGADLPPAANPPTPFQGVEFHPSEVCPKNFIIFDQTDHRSQIMFHPAIAHKFMGPSFNFHATYIQDNFERHDATNVGREMASSFKEDSDDIDALLSLEEGDEEEEYDEEEVSTARTCGIYGSDSPDSTSTYDSEPQHNKFSSMLKSSGSSSKCHNGKKRQKMKKMVNVLRGFVPGGNELNTVAVLDEAVRYLKSLKVEVQNLGVGNMKN